MLKIVFTSEDNENSMFGIEEFSISTEYASQLMRGDMTIEMLHSNIDAFYKQEVTREVKPFKKKKPSYQS